MAFVDPQLLTSIREALQEWNCDGFVVWKQIAAEWLEKNLDGQTQRSIARLMHEYVEAGGKIDQQAEMREGHRDRNRFHFDFRLSIDNRKIYIETTLDVTSTGPTVRIVSIHDA